jgi:glucuronoarabinoxylan endo-1,4-beta-xylanase
MWKRLCILVILGIVTFAQGLVEPSVESAAQVTVSIDASNEHQTIDGFGGAETWRLPPASLYPTIFDDLGISILRFQMFAYTESRPDQPGNMLRDNDNNDPFVIDWDGVETSAMTKFAPLLQAAQERGIKIIGTTTSPPAWMKENNEVETPGWFKSKFKDELVEFILIWVKGMEIFHGVHIDSVTIQNEPDFSPPWPGCRYNKFQMRDIIKLLGARFEAEGITTKIHVPDTKNFRSFQSYVKEICLDPAARKYVDRLATHPYDELFASPDSVIQDWKAASDLASRYGKNIWQTEYDGGKPQKWDQAFLAAQHVHNALVYGNVTAWLNYELYLTGANAGGLIGEAGPYRKFYTLKQYYRFVRPGTIRVESDSSDMNVMVTAFSHPEKNSLVIVAINRNVTGKTVRFNVLNHSPITSMEAFRTSSSENTAGAGKIQIQGNVFTVTLPKESITTFVYADLVEQKRTKGAKIRR